MTGSTRPTLTKLKESGGYDTDKSSWYLDAYEVRFAPMREREVHVLELGVNRGGSLLLWRDYFPRGTIVGVDLSPVPVDDPSGRIHSVAGNQADTAFLADLTKRFAPDGFDIIIDDASHLALETMVSFEYLFPESLKFSGYYVIEDWGTGYWGYWPDGATYRCPTVEESQGIASRVRSHNSGMVGLVKSLIDHCAFTDISRDQRAYTDGLMRNVAELTFRSGQVLIQKGRPPQPSNPII